MTVAKKRKPWVVPTVIGIGIVLAAVLIVVFLGLVPNVNASQGLQTRYEFIKDATLKTATLYDPDLGNDLVHQGGTEISLGKTSAKELQKLAVDVIYNAVYSESSADASLNDFDCRLRFNSEQDSTTIYLKGDRIYYTEDGVRHYFTVADPDALAKLKEYITESFDK